MRVVVVENACIPDPTGHHSGRGAYLHHDQRCLELATRRQAFSRALRHVGPLALDAVVALLARRDARTAPPTEGSAQPRVREKRAGREQ